MTRLHPGLLSDPAVQRIAEAAGRSAAQVSLRHSLQRGCAVLARSTTPARIDANAKLFDFERASMVRAWPTSAQGAQSVARTRAAGTLGSGKL